MKCLCSSSLLFTLFLLAAAAPAMGQTAGACSRDTLKSAIDRYFEALTAHDASRIPLASTVKFTENGKVLRPGEGLWKTAGKLTFQRNVIDTERCGSLTQGVMDEEGGDPIIFGVRLQWADRRITEVETYLARKTEFFQTPKGVPESDGDSWDSLLKPEERRSREELVAAADAYFNFFFDPKTVKAPFASPCNRWENGFRTTRGDCSNLGPAGRGGMQMTHRRYPVTDVEAGITAGFILFGNRLLDFHMFKIRNGKITQIQAVVGPAATTTGWEDSQQK